ncbi:MAG: hypothetical protein NW237_02970 [Cyanobacteriota bacterium]|nr:hypothetical protein [Cyanobacteriota bacterium]
MSETNIPELSLENLAEIESALDHLLTLNEEEVRELERLASRFPASD